MLKKFRHALATVGGVSVELLFNQRKVVDQLIKRLVEKRIRDRLLECELAIPDELEPIEYLLCRAFH